MATTQVARGSSTGGAPRAKRKAPFPIEFYRSALGKKYIMAITGIMLMGFVFAHMVGNLKMFLGPGHFNEYAEFLRELLVPIMPRTVVLWGMRLGLIAAFGLHIMSAYSLTKMNHAAREMKYQSKRDYVAANFASRSMRWTGIIVGLFLLFHLADLSWTGTFGQHMHRGDAYYNVDQSLSRLPVAIFYVIANVALGIHLFHGGWSLFQSMGWNNPRFNTWRRNFAAGFAALIVIGNCSFPIAVQLGVVGY